MGESLTGQTPKNTYTQLAHFGEKGALPEDGETPQILYKGDGTPTPISMTTTKVFINGVEVGAALTNAAVRAALGIPSYADLATANAALPIGRPYYDEALETMNNTTA